MEGSHREATESGGSSFLFKVFAVVVLFIVGWILIKLVLGIVSSIFASLLWTLGLVIIVVAVIWAWRTLKS
jgi:hypothetical protein